jgi:hypothetical protein
MLIVPHLSPNLPQKRGVVRKSVELAYVSTIQLPVQVLVKD